MQISGFLLHYEKYADHVLSITKTASPKLERVFFDWKDISRALAFSYMLQKCLYVEDQMFDLCPG